MYIFPADNIALTSHILSWSCFKKTSLLHN